MIDFLEDELQLLPNQGHCNDNYLLEKDGKKYLVRKFRLADRDRKREYRIQKTVSKRQIGAKPLFLDECRHILVAHFLDGEHKKKLTKREIRMLAKTLKRLHAIPTRMKPLTFTIQDKKIVQKIYRYKKELVLCHNDLNIKNILFSKVVKLIDWEYAGVGDKYFDLASVIEEFSFSKREEKVFLDTYFAHKKYNQQKLQSYKLVYWQFHKAWFDRYKKGKLNFLS